MRSVWLGTALTLCVLVGARQAGAAEAGKGANEPQAPAQAVAPAPAQAPATAPARAPAAGAGLVAFVDLATGKLVEPSAADMAALALAPEIQYALNMSTDGLREVPLPGGGYKLDMQGRFQSMLVATVGPDGKLRMGHPVALAARPAAPPPATAAEGDRK
jgi:hypothetical protein